MSESVMVIVADPDDAKRGEINFVEGPQKAARLVETLLEAGYEQTRIKVFNGSEMDMRVRHRPVVALLSSEDAAEAPQAEEAEAEAEPVTSNGKGEASIDAIAAEPYQNNGQKFSAAFRPA
jgi:hypothetical protein